MMRNASMCEITSGFEASFRQTARVYFKLGLAKLASVNVRRGTRGGLTRGFYFVEQRDNCLEVVEFPKLLALITF